MDFVNKKKFNFSKKDKLETERDESDKENEKEDEQEDGEDEPVKGKNPFFNKNHFKKKDKEEQEDDDSEDDEDDDEDEQETSKKRSNFVKFIKSKKKKVDEDDDVTEEGKCACQESIKTFSQLIESFEKGGLKEFSKDITNNKKLKSKDVEEDDEYDPAKTSSSIQVPKESKKNYENVDNETFTKEFEDQKSKMEGKKKLKGDAETPKTCDTVSEGLNQKQLDKREEIVKSMKKNMDTFRKHYGNDAKRILYATATKMALGKDVKDDSKEKYA